MMKFKFPELPRPRLKPTFDETLLGKVRVSRNPGRFALTAMNGEFGFFRVAPDAAAAILEYTGRFLKTRRARSYIVGFRRVYLVIEAGKVKK